MATGTLAGLATVGFLSPWHPTKLAKSGTKFLFWGRMYPCICWKVALKAYRTLGSWDSRDKILTQEARPDPCVARSFLQVPSLPYAAGRAMMEGSTGDGKYDIALGRNTKE